MTDHRPDGIEVYGGPPDEKGRASEWQQGPRPEGRRGSVEQESWREFWVLGERRGAEGGRRGTVEQESWREFSEWGERREPEGRSLWYRRVYWVLAGVLALFGLFALLGVVLYLYDIVAEEGLGVLVGLPFVLLLLLALVGVVMRVLGWGLGFWRHG